MKRTQAVAAGAVVAAALALTLGATRSDAQPSGVKRTVLQRSDIGATPDREAVTAKIEFETGVRSGRHTHPGEEVGYVLEGKLCLAVEGQAIVALKAGDTFFVEAGRPHEVINEEAEPAVVLATYIVGKGEPLATPVVGSF